MKLNKFLKNITLIFCSIIALSAWTKNNDTKLNISNYQSQLQIKNSFYHIDSQLTQQGYEIQNTNNSLTILYHNQIIPEASFWGPIGTNEAKKLYINLKDTLKNADIFLNNKLIQHTDRTGTALIDIYKEEGKYYLKLSNQDTDISMGYFFLLDNDTKLLCSGLKLICQKTNY